MTRKQDATQHSDTSFSTNKIKRRIRRIFLPERCESCNRLIPFNERECIHCNSIQYLIPEEFCIHCNRRSCICNEEVHRLELSVPFIYSGGIKHYIHRYKFAKEKIFADFFAESIYKALLNDSVDLDFDYVTFIPSSEGKRHGFNHSELIAERLARRLYCDCTPLLYRSRKTRKQHYLSYGERITNIKNAFSFNGAVSLKGKSVLVCDDIKTTGSTLLAAEKALLEGGAKRVYCCAVATPVITSAFPLDQESENLYN